MRIYAYIAYLAQNRAELDVVDVLAERLYLRCEQQRWLKEFTAGMLM